MKDEFVLLRLLILLSAGALVLGVVVRACQEADSQRARFSSAISNPLKSDSAFPVYSELPASSSYSPAEAKAKAWLSLDSIE